MSTHRLSTDLEELHARHSATGFTLQQVMALMGERGYGLLLVMLALPSAMPVPAPGYSTPFGVALFLIGVQILVGRKVPWLPGWVLNRPVSPGLGQKMLRFGSSFFSRLEHLIRPRYSWIFSRAGHALAGVLLLTMALLMIAPIPLTNTAPAGVIFLLGVGMVEKDGMVIGAALVLGCLALLLYLAAFYAIFHFGLQGVGELKELLRVWLTN
jgi:hypothetical protein